VLRRTVVALVAGILLLFPAALPAQNAAAFLLPHTVFVGDSARLVVTLGEAFVEVPPFVVENPAALNDRPDLAIRRVELERRGGVSRFLIDFIPFAPGELSFPTFEFTAPMAEPEEESLTLSDLRVQVASILTPESMDLSAPAQAMIVPGTGLLVYGSVAAVLLALALGIALSVWCKRNFRHFWQRLHRMSLLRATMRFLRRLGQEAKVGKSGSPEHYMGLLSSEFREFLGAFTGVNCRAFTPAEFLELPLVPAPLAVDEGAGVDGGIPFSPSFLYELFSVWDTLRFSGHGVRWDDLGKALQESEQFVRALYTAEKENARKKSPAGKMPPYYAPQSLLDTRAVGTAEEAL